MGALEHIATLRGHTDVVWSVAWSARGLLASCSADRSVRVWHCKDSEVGAGKEWACIATFGEGTFMRAVRDLSWATDGRSLACAGFDATAFVLELMGGKEPRLEAAVSLEGHDSEVKGVAYSSSGGLLASCSRDKSVWIWEVGLDFDYECIAVLNGHSADVKMVAWHPAIEMLVSCSYDGTVRVWVEDADDWFCSETLAAHEGTVWGAAFGADGRGLATVSADGSVVVWNREDGPDSVIGAHPCFKVIARSRAVHDGPIYTVDWNKENGLIATGGGDDAIRILQRIDAQTPTRPAHSPPTVDEGESVGIVRVREDGPSEDERAVTSALTAKYDVVGAEERAHTGDVNRVAWNPCAPNVLASCGDDGLVRIWKFDLKGDAEPSV